MVLESAPEAGEKPNKEDGESLSTPTKHLIKQRSGIKRKPFNVSIVISHTKVSYARPVFINFNFEQRVSVSWIIMAFNRSRYVQAVRSLTV